MIQTGIWSKLKSNLNKKPTREDLKVWKDFTTGNLPVEDKDNHIGQNKTRNKKIKKIDLHGFSLEEAKKKVEQFINDSYENKVEKIIVITRKGSRSKNDDNPYISKDLSIFIF